MALSLLVLDILQRDSYYQPKWCYRELIYLLYSFHLLGNLHLCCITCDCLTDAAAKLILQISSLLTHWGRVTHICVGNLTTIVSDNGLSPGRRQAIVWTNGGLLLIGPLGTNFSEILIETVTFSFKKMFLKVSSAKWRPFCLGLNVLISILPRGIYSYYLISYSIAYEEW